MKLQTNHITQAIEKVVIDALVKRALFQGLTMDEQAAIEAWRKKSIHNEAIYQKFSDPGWVAEHRMQLHQAPVGEIWDAIQKCLKENHGDVQLEARGNCLLPAITNGPRSEGVDRIAAIKRSMDEHLSFKTTTPEVIEAIMLKLAHDMVLTEYEQETLDRWRPECQANEEMIARFASANWIKRNLDSLYATPSAEMWANIDAYIRKNGAIDRLPWRYVIALNWKGILLVLTVLALLCTLIYRLLQAS